ncbi:MAG: response regulator [Terriglobales bacterium]
MDSRTTVLYVDDNPRSSRLLAGVLEQCGFRIIAKNDPAEALDLCRRSSFDLALLDYEMPAISGSCLAREIKLLMPDLPVVLISGRTGLPAPELEFVDAHFGFGTSLDDLLWTMRILVTPKVAVQDRQHVPGDRHFPDAHDSSRLMESRWSDST